MDKLLQEKKQAERASKIKVEQQKTEVESKQTLQKIQSETKALTEKNKKELFGTYKRTVIDSYLNTFSENYGDSFDYNSIFSAFDFKLKDDKNGINPSYTFNENKVKFDNKWDQNFANFNENAVPDFSKTNVIIDPNSIGTNRFDNLTEYYSYVNSGREYDNIKKLEGTFIPTTASERFSEFNRITKSRGYATKHESNLQASNKTENLWKSIYNKALLKFFNIKK